MRKNKHKSQKYTYGTLYNSIPSYSFICAHMEDRQTFLLIHSVTILKALTLHYTYICFYNGLTYEGKYGLRFNRFIFNLNFLS